VVWPLTSIVGVTKLDISVMRGGRLINEAVRGRSYAARRKALRSNRSAGLPS